MVLLLFSKNIELYSKHKLVLPSYEGCSIYNETVLITLTFYKVQRHK